MFHDDLLLLLPVCHPAFRASSNTEALEIIARARARAGGRLVEINVSGHGNIAGAPGIRWKENPESDEDVFHVDWLTSAQIQGVQDNLSPQGRIRVRGCHTADEMDENGQVQRSADVFEREVCGCPFADEPGGPCGVEVCKTPSQSDP